MMERAYHHRFVFARILPICRRGGGEGSACKIEHYKDLALTQPFSPLAFETLGPVNDEALIFLSELE